MSIKRAAASIVLCACACLCLCFPPSPAEAAAPCLWERVQTASFASELIIDLAVSPLYAQDGTLFALTFQNGSHYLWRTQDGALTWQKIAFSGGCCWDRIELSPDYGQAARVAYILGSGESGAMLWYSADAGNNWLVRPLPEGTGSPSPIAVASDGSLFVAGYDGLSGRSFVCYSADAGNNFTAGGTLGTVPAYSLAVSRSYGQAVLLAGDTWGEHGFPRTTPVPSSR